MKIRVEIFSETEYLSVRLNVTVGEQSVEMIFE